jgi:teichuronic acid exporter
MSRTDRKSHVCREIHGLGDETAQLNLRQKVFSGLRWSAGGRLFAQLITWAITIVVVRLLTPDDFGLMTMAMILYGFLTMVNEMGLGAAIIQKQDIDESTLQKILGFLLIINGILLFVAFGSAPVIADFFNESRLTPIIRLLAIQFAVIPFGVIPQSLLDSEMLFGKRAIIELISALTGSVTTLILALTGFGVWSLIWGSLSLTFCRTVGLNIIRPYFKLPHVSLENMRHFVKFSGYVTLTRMVWFVFVQADVFVVGKILGKELLGFYSVAQTLAYIPMDKVSGIINQVAFPAFSKIQKDPEWATALCLKSVRIMSMIVFPVLWGISSIAHELVAVFLGERWGMAVIPFKLLSLIVPLRMISGVLDPALYGFGRPEISLHNIVFASAIMYPCIIVGTYWGIAGVGVAWVSMYPFVAIYNFSRIAHTLRIPFRDFLMAMAWPAFAAGVMYVSVEITRNSIGLYLDPVLSLIFLALLGAVVYSGLILIFYRGGCQEVLRLIH